MKWRFGDLSRGLYPLCMRPDWILVWYCTKLFSERWQGIARAGKSKSRIMQKWNQTACKNTYPWHIKNSFKTDGRNALRHACLDAYRNVTGQLRRMTLQRVRLRRHLDSSGCLPFFYRRKRIRIMMMIQMNIGYHLLITRKREAVAANDASAFCRQHSEYTA